MEEARPILCDCGHLLCKVLDGEVIVWCKRCKKEIAVPITEQFTRITKDMQTEHDCKCCADRIGMYCPHGECKY